MGRVLGEGEASMRQETSGGSLPHVDLLRQVTSGLTSRVEEILVGSDLTLDQWRVVPPLPAGGPPLRRGPCGRPPTPAPPPPPAAERPAGAAPRYPPHRAAPRHPVVARATPRRG